jgi:hypothetical protein
MNNLNKQGNKIERDKLFPYERACVGLLRGTPLFEIMKTTQLTSEEVLEVEESLRIVVNALQYIRENRMPRDEDKVWEIPY